MILSGLVQIPSSFKIGVLHCSVLCKEPRVFESVNLLNAIFYFYLINWKKLSAKLPGENPIINSFFADCFLCLWIHRLDKSRGRICKVAQHLHNNCFQ